MDGTTYPALDAVEAPINYLERTGARPAAYQYEPPPGVPVRSGVQAPRRVRIRDARPLIGTLSLDREGFDLVPFHTAVTDYDDSAAVRQRYYADVERAVKAATGASRVIVFDHNVRHGAADARIALAAKEPVKRPHNDYTAKSGWQRARDLLPPAEAERLLKHRFAVINLWRPVAAPVLESPLAVADAHSIAPEDLIETDLIYRDRRGETYGLAHNPAHRWFYFPRQRPDEALLIKCFDSAEDGRARFTAHSAFDDPTSPADAPPRHSIEARTFAFFAPAA